MRQSEWQSRNGSLQTPKLRMHGACDRNISSSFLEIAAPNVGHERDRWPDTKGGSSLSRYAIVSGDKSNFGGTEPIIHSKTHGRGLLVAFGNAEVLAGGA